MGQGCGPESQPMIIIPHSPPGLPGVLPSPKSNAVEWSIAFLDRRHVHDKGVAIIYNFLYIWNVYYILLESTQGLIFSSLV